MDKGINSQTPQTRRLAALLRKTHRRYKSWRLTAIIHNITNAHGAPNKGLAYRIAINGYEPRDPALRSRLGLPDAVCPECHHKVRPPTAMRPWRRLSDLNDAEILYLLQHQETIP